MGKINDSHFVSILRNRRTRLGPDPSRGDSSTISGRTSQLEFDAATNRAIPLPEAIQSTSGKGNKQPVWKIWKKCIQEEDKIVMECYYQKLMGIDNECIQYGEARVCLI